jgi:hypothetical protein
MTTPPIRIVTCPVCAKRFTNLDWIYIEKSLAEHLAHKHPAFDATAIPHRSAS